MTKVGHATLKENHLRTTEDVLYADMMAKAAPRRQKKKIPETFNGKAVKDLTSEEREEFLLSMQPPSTQACLRRKPEDDAAWFNRGFGDWKAVKDAKTEEEAVGMRFLRPDEVTIEERRRRRTKNTQGTTGSPGISEETREKGIQAFTYSTPANLTAEEKKRLTKLEPIVSTPFEPEEMTERDYGFMYKLFVILPQNILFGNDKWWPRD